MEDENPKKGETHESQGTDGDGPPPEKAGANRLAGGFDFLLPDVNLLHVGKLALEFPGALEKVERRGSGIAENLEEFLAFWGIREKWFEEGCELGGVFQKRGFGGSGECGGVPQSGGSLGGESVVMGTEQAGGDGGGFHLGQNGAQQGGQPGAGGEIEFFCTALQMQERGVGRWFHGDKNPLFLRNGFIERIDPGVIEAGKIPDAFGKPGGTNGWNENLNITRELMVASPVEATQRMRAGGRNQLIGAETPPRKILHQLRDAEGEVFASLQ
jgi:hypothetical protein